MSDFAGQPFERLAEVLERLAVKQASGDPSALDDLRRELRAIAGESVQPARPPVVFRGKKQRAFEALLQGATGMEAAKRAGTDRTSISRWLAGEDFKRALNAARAERVVVAQEGLADLLPLSVRRLRGILLDPSATHRDLIAAATAVMDRAGMPKTERVEVHQDGQTEIQQLDTDELRERIRRAEAGLTLIEGGIR